MKKCFVGKQMHCGTTRAIFTSLFLTVYFSLWQGFVRTVLLWNWVPCLTVTSHHISKGKKSSNVNSSSSFMAIWADGGGWCDLRILFILFKYFHKVDVWMFFQVDTLLNIFIGHRKVCNSVSNPLKVCTSMTCMSRPDVKTHLCMNEQVANIKLDFTVWINTRSLVSVIFTHSGSALWCI